MAKRYTDAELERQAAVTSRLRQVAEKTTVSAIQIGKQTAIDNRRISGFISGDRRPSRGEWPRLEQWLDAFERAGGFEKLKRAPSPEVAFDPSALGLEVADASTLDREIIDLVFARAAAEGIGMRPAAIAKAAGLDAQDVEEALAGKSSNAAEALSDWALL